MDKKYILYLTTNSTWGGSEVLWSHSAQKFIEDGLPVKAAAYYDYKLLEQNLQSNRRFIDLKESPVKAGLTQKIINKLKPGKNLQFSILSENIKKDKPALVIISQGNNKDGLNMMQLCVDYQIPFVTIIHLVSESLWPGLDDERINRLNILFEKSRMNYFVSKHTLFMHETILGKKFSNNKIIYNPFTKAVNDLIPFPPSTDFYKVALIGRIENFHKGYDLLIDVIKEKKWQERNIRFSIFGKGPHLELLNRLIAVNNIKNISILEHVEDISEIWKKHHILMMPSRMEGQSLSLIEAMRFKRAAIVTNVGGVEELIEDNVSGFIAAFPTAMHIDDALERAWNERNRWEKMGLKASEKIIKTHPADAVLYFNKQIEKLLESI